jgi:outer membrane lipoprotein-sorting protein
MRRFVVWLAACLLSLTAFAQTPEEIVNRMEETMDKLEVSGTVMTMDIKIPILGTMSTKAWNRGDKTRIEGEMKGVKVVTFIDGDTEWEYNSSENKVRIKRHDTTKESSEESNAKLFDTISEGYDVSLNKETATAWHLRCKKSRNNTHKDDPKTIDLVVDKDTYYPVSLSTKVSGITVVLRDLGFDVTEKQVTFNPADYPGATIIDER